MKKHFSYFDYFVGGVPAGDIFFMNTKELKKVLKRNNWKKFYNQTRVEICFIGLTAYFEAFFKDHFASIINIHPQLIDNLKQRGFDISVNLTDIIKYKIDSPNKYGFILSEKYDFGSAKKINSIYQALINISPFSADEIESYDFFLNSRNLIVHHGGIFTTKFADLVFKKTELSERVFFDSIIISKELMTEYIVFCEETVRKTMNATRNKVYEIIKANKIKINRNLKAAIESLYSEI